MAYIGVPRAFRTDHNSEYTNRIFVEYCDGVCIHRELTPCTPWQDVPLESTLARIVTTKLAARFEVNNLFPDMHLERIKSVRDRCGTSL